MNINEIKNAIKNSVFNRENNELSIPITKLSDSLMKYVYYYIHNGIFSRIGNISTETMPKFVAPFQRDYKPWDIKRKIAFVENVILGHRTTISLYSLKNDKSDCFLLDGQHRLHAILEFIEGDFKLFDNLYTFEELKENRVINSAQSIINLKIYTFNQMEEVIDFYVQINKDVTHSPEDIEKALNYVHQ